MLPDHGRIYQQERSTTEKERVDDNSYNSWWNDTRTIQEIVQSIAHGYQFGSGYGYRGQTKSMTFPTTAKHMYLPQTQIMQGFHLPRTSKGAFPNDKSSASMYGGATRNTRESLAHYTPSSYGKGGTAKKTPAASHRALARTPSENGGKVVGYDPFGPIKRTARAKSGSASHYYTPDGRKLSTRKAKPSSNRLHSARIRSTHPHKPVHHSQRTLEKLLLQAEMRALKKALRLKIRAERELVRMEKRNERLYLLAERKAARLALKSQREALRAARHAVLLQRKVKAEQALQWNFDLWKEQADAFQPIDFLTTMLDMENEWR